MSANRYKINCRQYHVFYQKFEPVYIKHAFPNGFADNETLKRTTMWQEVNKTTGICYADEIFCNKPDDIIGTSDRNYLHKQLSLLKIDPSNPDKTGSILAAPLFYALEFLGYQLPEDRDSSDLLWSEKADILFKQFIKGPPESNQKQIEMPSNFAKVKGCVERFYHCIASMKLDEAWACLSPTFQMREIWEGNIERFKDGYVTTRGITEICGFNMVEVAQNVIKCKIFYRDEVATYPLKGLSEIQNLTVEETDVFLTGLNKIRADIEKKNGKNFGSIPLRKFFDKTSMEFIWYECGFEGKNLHKLFPKPYVEHVNRLFDCTCVFIDGKWLINNIDSGVNTYAIR